MISQKPSAARTVHARQAGSTFLCCLQQILTLPFKCCSRDQDRPENIFSNVLLSNFSEFVYTVASVSYPTEVEPGVDFCCYSPCALTFDVLRFQR